MPVDATPSQTLAADLVDHIEELLLKSESAGQPMELDPQRSRLFELFVMADAAGFLVEDAQHDLSSDGIARTLASRWDLASAVGPAFTQPSKLPPAQFARMRLLWSFMRLWMEWTYAWKRWEEFHESAHTTLNTESQRSSNSA